MREIKFRAWHRILKEMRGNHTSIQILADRNSSFPNSHNHLYTLMQYTGLNDKNQKEIYEGDILRWDNPGEDSIGLYIVRWNLNRFEITHESRGYIFALDKTHNFEIIGNIYQKPELTINQPTYES